MAAHIPAPNRTTSASTSGRSTNINLFGVLQRRLRLYTNVMAVFESAQGGQTRVQIRELVTNNPRNSSLGYATLVLSAANPAHQGLIYRVHYVANFGTRLGHSPTKRDGHIFGSINDVVGHQIPTTIELPVDAFARQDGGVS
jgi:hypothetical protein